MGSLVDVESVRRHLQALGHRVDSRGAATLLRDLGFDVAPEPGPVPVVDRQNEIRTHSKSAVTAKTGVRSAKQDGLTALAARLEALEAQLGRLGARHPPERAYPWSEISQDMYATSQSECEACAQWATGPHSGGGVGSPRCVLGNEARQLRDFAAGCWPTVAAEIRHVDSADCVSQDSSPPQRRSGAGGRGTKQRRRGKTDPVARYQELQRMWARDPFLRSGGDGRVSLRKAEGFRDAFEALHACGRGSRS